MRNLKSDVTEDQLKEHFESYGKIERVKKIKDYGFVHFEDRDSAVKAMEGLNGSVSMKFLSTSLEPVCSELKILTVRLHLCINLFLILQ